MEPRRVRRQPADQRPEPVGVFPVKRRMLGQVFRNRGGGFGRGKGDLHHEPLIQNQPVIRPFRIEGVDLILTLTDAQQGRQRGQTVGHIVRAIVMRAGQRAAVNAAQQTQSRPAQRPPPCGTGVRRIGARRVHLGVDRAQGRFQPRRHRAAQRPKRVVDRHRIGGTAAVEHGLRQIILGRQAKGQRAERWIQRIVRDDLRHGVDIARNTRVIPVQQVQQNRFRQGATGLPFVERVGVMGQQERVLIRATRAVEDHRGREIAQHRCNRRGTQPVKPERLLRLGQFQNLRRNHLIPVRGQQANRDRNVQRLRIGLAFRFWYFLFYFNFINAIVKAFIERQARRARLGVPAFELAKVATGGVLEHLQPILDRGRVPVVTIKVQVQRVAIPVRTHKGAQHADHLGPFFIDRRGVKVIDFNIMVRPHRMGQRAVVFTELTRAQHQNILNPLDRVAAHVARELLIAIDRQTLFQAQLKPVATGDPVAGPVVEILMRDD